MLFTLIWRNFCTLKNWRFVNFSRISLYKRFLNLVDVKYPFLERFTFSLIKWCRLFQFGVYRLLFLISTFGPKSAIFMKDNIIFNILTFFVWKPLEIVISGYIWILEKMSKLTLGLLISSRSNWDESSLQFFLKFSDWTRFKFDRQINQSIKKSSCQMWIKMRRQDVGK